MAACPLGECFAFACRVTDASLISQIKAMYRAMVRHWFKDNGEGEPAAEAHVCGPEHAGGFAKGSLGKKVIGPSQRREMAENAVARRGASIAVACRALGVSETCYSYGPKLRAENEEIADLLVGLTDARKTWGFGLCFLHLRNVKGHPWNHKRVYLRIPRKMGAYST